MNRIFIKIVFGFLCLFSVQNANSQWLDPQILQATVLLEKIQNNTFITHGTGILMYNYDNPHEFIVVTCAHLLKGKNQICVRVKPDTSFLNTLSQTGQEQLVIENIIVFENTVRFMVNLGRKDIYIHPELDIAAFRLQIPRISHYTDTSETIVEMTKLLGIPRSRIEYKKDLSLGDEVYFVGFPLGYGATSFVEPIVRSGSIAWLPTNERIFLLDAFSYGGNSGSPIFRKRIIGSKPGTLEWSESKLVGMIIGHQSIILENILNQPNSEELKFEKTDIELNIGLARCVYIDDIIFTINKLIEISN